MGFFHNLMDKLGRYRLIPDRKSGKDYMHRYYLFLKDRKRFPFNVTLHKIVRSDDPIFHDHPWPYMTIILSGGYYEHTPVFDEHGKQLTEVFRWYGPGSIIFRSANDYHRLELLDEEKPVTTLFFMGPQQKEWGFMANTKEGYKWMHFKEYLYKFLKEK